MVYITGNKLERGLSISNPDIIMLTVLSTFDFKLTGVNTYTIIQILVAGSDIYVLKFTIYIYTYVELCEKL